MSSLVGEVQVLNVEGQLRSDAMKGKWPVVFETCKQERALWTAKITGMGDTVFHMAVSSAKEKEVVDMVDFLVEQEKSLAQNNVVVIVDGDSEEKWSVNTVLSAENDRKNTPLHLAAIRGNVKICKKISEIETSLIARRNIAGETPLFLAALNGWKEAFLWLHYLYVGSHEVSSVDFARDNNDNTILHCAIAEGHAGVAIEIIHLYKDHLNEMVKRNKEGLSPLHLLAAQRLAFKSTSLPERSILIRPIYRLLRVKKKKQATTMDLLEMEELKRTHERERQPCGKAPCDALKGCVTILGRWLQQMWLPHIISRRASDPEDAAQEEEENENEESIAVDFEIFICLVLLVLRMILLSPYYLFDKAGKWLHQIRRMKERHTWSVQIMKELLQHASDEDMSQVISRTASQQLSLKTKEKSGSMSMATPVVGTITIETPLMIAAKNGVEEMVREILTLFPLRIEDVNDNGKNAVLLAVECRQKNVYMILDIWQAESLCWRVDEDRNNALHLAARLGVELDWLNAGAELSMSNEIKWFEYVKNSLPRALLERYNREMKTPEDIFKESHKELMKSEGEWVAQISQACSVVSTLVISVAFDTRNTVPGGYDTQGYAILRNKPLAFKCFSYASFSAVCCSLMSTICFLSTLVAARSQSVHSWKYIPIKLYYGMCYMFMSIICLWVSFCGGYFFTMDDRSQKSSHVLQPYILASLPIIVLVVSQVPTFLGPILPRMGSIPASRRKAIRPIEYRN